uniref:G protein-coupled receptor 149 n=1 Tax=Hippocampus comes TaxID=109280 RepID=A0A3Q2YMB5_HIPCM
MLVRHAANARSSSLETLGFFLTLLAPAVTPLFVLSKRWIHLPCGCFINCNREPTPDPSGSPESDHTVLTDEPNETSINRLSSLDKSFGTYNELSPSSCGTTCELKESKEAAGGCPRVVCRQKSATAGDPPVVFAQKRFSMVLAVVRVTLWMPMMMSNNTQTLGFFLTLLAPAVTPLFVLSKRWIHLPCGCFINCNREPTPDPSGTMKRRLEFNLSLQKSCGVFKLSHAAMSHGTAPAEKRAYHSLFNSDFPNSRLDALETGGLCRLGPNSSATLPVDSSFHSDLLLEDERHFTDTSSVFEDSERRLSHEEGRKIELTDWEWCRSKSERTQRQRSTTGLSIPLCAFQGTVSLQAPTGKTLSLSTYEVSSDGLRISPQNSKRVEVYRSKSVGHEPNIGMGIGTAIGDTNVKIHLEVLEICDNEEAMDSVSIVSNISQSSTHARSPSLRYSRRENRFVSYDLGETASYSLLIPTSGNAEAEAMSITIPDTVEAHRQNSLRQTQASTGYQEEIQLLNEAYRKQAGDAD